jgi:hypothetical protein
MHQTPPQIQATGDMSFSSMHPSSMEHQLQRVAEVAHYMVMNKQL